MKKIGRNSLIFDDVFIENTSVVTGPKEKDGPIGNYYDYSYDNNYCNEKTWEKAEIALVKKAFEIVCIKEKLGPNEIDVMFGGDLNNQIAISTYAMRNTFIPFFGTFAACSTITENIILGSIYVDTLKSAKVLVSSSSHNATSERQFRYPTEYGGQKPTSMTFTATAAGMCLLGSRRTNIRVKSGTIGKIIDVKQKDAQDMGRVMAPSAAETLFDHLTNFGETINDYDAIITGDLSIYGSELFIKCCAENGIMVRDKHQDAGKNLYDIKRQKVFAGGSGCGCITAYLLSYVVAEIVKGTFKRVLVLATGALLNPVMIAQKDTIPCISHAIALERCD